MKRALGMMVVVLGFVVGGGVEARGQFTIGTDPPGYVPGRGNGFGVNTFGYGGYGPRGYGYYTPLPDIGYYSGGPSEYYSPIFNSMAAAPRQSGGQVSRYSAPYPVSAAPPGRNSPRNRSTLRRLFSR